ncbi:MAG: acyltransferase [Treponema phagedenis]|uniref:acyltransferase n=1 Tax=Treponema phagedenis TaxID=162 RepID=UPI003133EABB
MKLRMLYFFHLFLFYILPDSCLKNLLKTTPFLEIRNKIWLKFGNVLGKDAYINNSIVLIDASDLRPNIVLGDRVALAPCVTFITDSSPNNSILGVESNTKKYCKKGTITIGDDTWIGANTVIQPGITIGKCCIIGSMSNVTKNIPDYSLAYGNPAKIIRKIEL